MLDTISLTPNYRITIAKNETVARIYLETKGKKVSKQNIATVMGILTSKAGVLMQEISQVMAAYRGHLLSECRIEETHNKIPNVLRYEMAKLIAGQSPSPTFVANYIAVGNGITPPENIDTQLGSELARGLFTTRTSDLNTAYLDKFFPATEVGGLTITEVGTFVDGTASPDSGYLLSRIATNLSISANETLTLNVSISFNSAT